MENREADQGWIRSLLEADELEMSVVISDPARPDGGSMSALRPKADMLALGRNFTNGQKRTT